MGRFFKNFVDLLKYCSNAVLDSNSAITNCNEITNSLLK